MHESRLVMNRFIFVSMMYVVRTIIWYILYASFVTILEGRLWKNKFNVDIVILSKISVRIPMITWKIELGTGNVLENGRFLKNPGLNFENNDFMARNIQLKTRHSVTIISM